MKKFKSRIAKVGITFMVAGALAFGSASLVSAEVIPVSCSPTADGGMYVTLYDTISEMYAVILAQ